MLNAVSLPTWNRSAVTAGAATTTVIVTKVGSGHVALRASLGRCLRLERRGDNTGQIIDEEEGPRTRQIYEKDHEDNKSSQNLSRNAIVNL
jgi:hypothetical protein